MHVHVLPVWGQRTPRVYCSVALHVSFAAGSLTDLTSTLCDLPVNNSELQACDAILGLFSFEAGSKD